MNNYKEMGDRYASSYAHAMKWVSQITEALRYVTPERSSLSTIFKYYDQGTPKSEAIHNSSAEQAAYTRAAKLINILMPQNRRWASLISEKEKSVLKQKNMYTSDLDQEISNAEDVIFTTLTNSNFYYSLAESFLDLCVTGGAICIEPAEQDTNGFDSINTYSVAGASVFPEMSIGSRVDNKWMHLFVSKYYILRKFKDILKKPAYSNLRDYISNSAEQGIVLIKGSYRIMDGQKPKWQEVLFLKDFSELPLSDVTKDYESLIYFREWVRPSESIGRGVALRMLPIIRRLNEIEKLDDDAAKLRAFPPFELDSELANVGALGRNDLIASFFPKGTFGEAMALPSSPQVAEKIMRFENQIKEAFDIQFLGDVETAPVRSASEINARAAEMRTSDQVMVFRLVNEVTKPIFNTVVSILEKQKKIKIPKVLSREYAYLNPVGDEEKKQTLSELFNTAEGVQQTWGPQVLSGMTSLSKLRDVLSKNSDSDFFKDNDQMKKLMETMAASQQPQQQQAPQAMPQQQLPQSGGF